VPWKYDKTRIQNKLREIVASVSYPRIVYAGDDSSSVDEADSASPQSVEVNQVSKEMEIDRRYGRDLVYIPAEWRFDLRVSFGSEVDLSDLEAILFSVPFTERDKENDHPQVLLTVTNTDHEEPPRRGGPMRVVYQIDAEVERN